MGKISPPLFGKDLLNKQLDREIAKVDKKIKNKEEDLDILREQKAELEKARNYEPKK